MKQSESEEFGTAVNKRRQYISTRTDRPEEHSSEKQPGNAAQGAGHLLHSAPHKSGYCYILSGVMFEGCSVEDGAK